MPGKVGAPLGNKNAVKERRLWGETIRRVVTQGNSKRLRSAAERLVAVAEKGDVGALRELGDRLDGKVPQGIFGPGEHGEHVVEFRHALE